MLYGMGPLKGLCMKGSKTRMKNGRWQVNWYHNKRNYAIRHYNGFTLDTEEMADRLLTVMRNDMERGIFRIEKFVRIQSEVVSFIKEWFDTVVINKTPGTQATYQSIIRCYLNPYFTERNITLQEIDYMELMKFANWMPVAGSTKHSVLRIFKGMLEFARKTNRIKVVPPIPSRDDCKVVRKPIKYLPHDVQDKVIQAIPESDRPIFVWMSLYARRPNEATALMKRDLMGDTFILRRAWSGYRLIDRIKTNKVIELPLLDEFMPYLEWMKKQEYWLESPFMFVNPEGRKEGKYYSRSLLQHIWKKACKEVGVDISMYAGTKHSSVTHMLQQGINKYDIALALGCSVKTIDFYAAVEVEDRKRIFQLRSDANRCEVDASAAVKK